MGKESQLLEAAAAGNNSKVEVSGLVYIFIACMQYALMLASSRNGLGMDARYTLLRITDRDYLLEVGSRRPPRLFPIHRRA